MTHAVLHTQATAYKRSVPPIRPGYTVRVHERIQEGSKERVQVFEGLVISVHNGHTAADASFTVRKIASGIGVEKVFPLHCVSIERIEVKKVAKVRRAKLFFLRGRTGKAARLIERFTNAGEFQAAAVESETVEEQEVPEAEAQESQTDDTQGKNVEAENAATEQSADAS